MNGRTFFLSSARVVAGECSCNTCIPDIHVGQQDARSLASYQKRETRGSDARRELTDAPVTGNVQIGRDIA